MNPAPAKTESMRITKRTVTKIIPFFSLIAAPLEKHIGHLKMPFDRFEMKNIFKISLPLSSKLHPLRNYIK
jgi:hypothetical protein